MTSEPLSIFTNQSAYTIFWKVWNVWNVISHTSSQIKMAMWTMCMVSIQPCKTGLFTFPRLISYARCDWLFIYKRVLWRHEHDILLHRVYQMGEGGKRKGSRTTSDVWESGYTWSSWPLKPLYQNWDSHLLSLYVFNRSSGDFCWSVN